MKYLLVLACVLVVAYGLSPEIQEMIKAEIAKKAGECKGEVGATDDDLATLKSHNPPATRTGKCFISCMDKKFGFQDASGKIDKEATYATIERIKIVDEDLFGKMKQITDACLAKVTDDVDECETATKMMMCMEEENKSVGITEFDF